MSKKKEYKFIVAEDSGSKHNGKPWYKIFNKISKEQIGTITWYSVLNKYVFSTSSVYVFEAEFLQDIVDFMKNETK